MSSLQELAHFKEFYRSLNVLQAKDLYEFGKNAGVAGRGDEFFRAIMPTVQSIGKVPFECRAVFHPKNTCSGYMKDRLLRGLSNGLKISAISCLLPTLMRSRKELLAMSPKKRLKKLL